MKYIVLEYFVLLVITAFVFSEEPKAVLSLSKAQNGFLLDSSGNQQHAVLKNGPVLLDKSTVYCDGIDDRLEVNINNSSRMVNAFTLWVAVKPVGNRKGYKRLLYCSDSKDERQLAKAPYILCLTANNEPEIIIGTTNNTYQYVIAKERIPEERWSILTATYDSMRLRLYINAKLVAEKTLTTPTYLRTTERPLHIGCGESGRYPFHGFMKMIKLYSSALSETDIKKLSRKFSKKSIE